MVDKQDFVTILTASTAASSDSESFEGTNASSDRFSMSRLIRMMPDHPHNVWYSPATLLRQPTIVNAVAFHEPSGILANVSSNRISMYDVSTQKLLCAFADPDVNEEFLCVDFSKDGRLVYAAGLLAIIRVVPVRVDNPPYWGQLRTLQGHGGPIRAIHASLLGRVVTGCDDGSCRLWDVEEARTLVRFSGVNAHTKGITALSEHASRAKLVSCSPDLVCLWDIPALVRRSGRSVLQHFPYLRVSNVHCDSPIASIFWLDDLLISIAQTGPILIWEPKKESHVVARLNIHGRGVHRAPLDQQVRITRLAVDVKSMAICGGCSDGSVYMWDLLSVGECLDDAEPVLYEHMWSSPKAPITDLCFGGRYLIACCKREIGLWMRQESNPDRRRSKHDRRR